MGRDGRKSHPRAPRNQSRGRWRYGGGARRADGHRRQDQPRRGCGARLGKCCIVGCEKLYIDYAAKQMSADGHVVHQGDWITLDGNDGSVYEVQVQLVTPEMPKHYHTILKWADEIRRLDVRANADTAQDARKAREMGAEGIGLCRTEHMFFKDFEQPERSADRQLAIQEMIIADTPGSPPQGARQACGLFSAATSSESSRPWMASR